MSIFDRLSAAGGIVPQRTSAVRPGAEEYAFSLGLTPGGPGWGDAVRAYVLSGAGAESGGTGTSYASGRQAPPMLSAGSSSGPLGASPLYAHTGPAFASTPHTRGFQPGPSGSEAIGLAKDGSVMHPDASSALSPHVMERGEERFGVDNGGAFGDPSEPGHAVIGPRYRPALLGRQRAPAEPPGSSTLNRGLNPVSPGRPTSPHGPASPERPTMLRLPSGRLSAQEETGGRGPGTVSSGVNDPGGISYGSYQLSSKKGQVQTFLQSDEGSRWARQLQGLRPGTPEFKARWQQIAAREGDAFQAAQHNYIGRTHYTPAVTTVRRETGLDLDTMPNAVRDAAWSATVQHSTAPTVLTNAVKSADARLRQGDGSVDRNSPAYQEALINEMYNARTALVTRLINSPKTAPGDRRTFRNVIKTRYPRERAAALRQLREEQGRPEQPE
jgi:hypothetical protein